MVNEAKWRALLEIIGNQLMDDNEKNLLAKSPERFEIFRGCKKETDLGFPWSKEYEWASWFARNCYGVMLESSVKRADVIAYLAINNEEHEIIVLPERVADISLVGNWGDLYRVTSKQILRLIDVSVAPGAS